MKYNYPRSNCKRKRKMIVRKILLSPGHGINTPGKRSPDGSLLEWKFNRQLVKKIAEGLDEEHIPYMLLDMGATDVTLQGRVVRANTFGRDCLYISVHGNAAGNGKDFNKAEGWEAFTSKGTTKSDAMCEIFCKKAEEILVPMGCKIRKASAKKAGKDENFFVLKNTIMPAILTENLFYTNLFDIEIMKSEEGIAALARVHVEAIKEIYNKEF